MRGRTLLLYATADDLIPRLNALEEMLPVKYVMAGMFRERKPTVYETFHQIPSLGICPSGDSVCGVSYLIMHRQIAIFSREIELNSGETRFEIDYETNPVSVIFRPGGVVQNERAIIQGSISALTRVHGTDEFYKVIVKHLTKGFVKVKGHRVGPQAAQLSREGFRLTASLRGNPEYDLRI